jgi:primosomal protein N' (replication factor Y)
MCSLGEVMAAALPAVVRPEGDAYRPATEVYVSLGAGDVNEAFESLARAPKQYKALLEIAEAGGAGVPRKRLKADAATLGALEKKGFIAITRRELAECELPALPAELPTLSPAQQKAFDEIKEKFETAQVVVLQGVTGSGKTEIYVNLIAEQLAAGRNVLYLLPEIAMSSQLVRRVRSWFGERVVVYHSRLTGRQRAAVWERVRGPRGGVVVLGVRSAVMLPVRDLGLVVVDEEHDASYKQDDPAPRYHARDAAIVLARAAGARVLLGSATPSLESFFNARGGKYGYVELTERYGGAPLPQVMVSDTMKAVARGERTAHFNKLLLDDIADTLAAGRQVMLFQNRRGFAPYVECAECGSVVMCRQCNVAMTWHRGEGVLRCHYCGRAQGVPPVCPVCGAAALEPRGFGTEKAAEEVARLVPEARVARLDRDTAVSARRYESTIAAFERGETDILVGTQMITKGFDFGGVALVGILNADNLLAYPDFRAAERAFQTITQMAGRCGRRGERGRVVIQTAQPANTLIRQAADGDYGAMAREQLAERADFLYPPYCRLIEVTLRHRDATKLWDAANRLAAAARATFGKMLLGPQPPLVDKVRGEELLTLMLKVERGSSFADARRLLGELLAGVRGVRVSVNVDPQRT